MLIAAFVGSVDSEAEDGVGVEGWFLRDFLAIVSGHQEPWKCSVDIYLFENLFLVTP